MLVYEIREDIVDDALKEVYDKYMLKQTYLFTAHVAAKAWIKLLEWNNFCHDPGEDPSACPPCYIPKRAESWIPDELPEPAPRDTWCRQPLPVDLDLTEHPEDRDLGSAHSIEIPVLEDIPREYWFPGKVNLGSSMKLALGIVEDEGSSDIALSSEGFANESEVLQKITDYSNEEIAEPTTEHTTSITPPSPAMTGSQLGAGDSMVDRRQLPRRRTMTFRNRTMSKVNMGPKSRISLQPLGQESRSRLSIISDCRLRNLRLDTNFDVTAERILSPPPDLYKRK